MQKTAEEIRKKWVSWAEYWSEHQTGGRNTAFVLLRFLDLCLWRNFDLRVTFIWIFAVFDTFRCSVYCCRTRSTTTTGVQTRRKPGHLTISPLIYLNCCFYTFLGSKWPPWRKQQQQPPLLTFFRVLTTTCFQNFSTREKRHGNVVNSEWLVVNVAPLNETGRGKRTASYVKFSWWITRDLYTFCRGCDRSNNVSRAPESYSTRGLQCGQQGSDPFG